MPKRTEEQREHDLALTAALYLHSVPTDEIAMVISEQYGDFDLTPRTIRNDLQELRKRWIEAQLVNFDEAKARELTKLDELEHQLYKGWERSMTEYTSQETENSTGDVPVGGTEFKTLTSTKIKNKIEQRDGAVVFLQEIRKVIDQRCKILGLYEPEKFAVDWRTELVKQGYSPSEADEMISQAADIVDASFKDSE